MNGDNEAVLGISAFGHDTSACLVAKSSGEVLYAVAEERLTNVKHDSRFPAGGIKQCTDVASQRGMKITDVALNFNDIEFIQGALTNEIRLLVTDRAAANALIDKLEDVYAINEYYFEGTMAKRVIDAMLDHPEFSVAMVQSFAASLHQITGQVRWVESMNRLRAMGIRTFVEVGPGKVLAGLGKRINPDWTVLPAGTPAELEAVAEMISEPMAETR